MIPSLLISCRYLPTQKAFGPRPDDLPLVYRTMFNREIKGWDVANSMDAENTQKALIGAFQSSPGALQDLTFHSDQGSQYDNVFAESCFHPLKTELEKERFENLEEARRIRERAI